MISFLRKSSLLKITSYTASNCCNVCFNLSPVSKLINPDTFEFGSTNVFRLLHSSASLNASHFKPRDRRDLLRSVPKMDEGVIGEKVVSLDAIISSREDMFTDERTPDLLFNGVPFRELPVISLKISKNNTFATLSDHKGKIIYLRCAGKEGFKNCRKGTNVAGQTVGTSVSSKAVKLGITDVRLKIRGLGPGRMASIKGVQMGGLNIISVTDDTRVSFRPSYRPRKPRRL